MTKRTLWILGGCLVATQGCCGGAPAMYTYGWQQSATVEAGADGADAVAGADAVTGADAATGADAVTGTDAATDAVTGPPAGLVVELSWTTPGDPDPTDAVHAEISLHAAHPLAAGPDLDCDGQPDPWFSNPFDVFWFNPQPQWGSVGSVADDPVLTTQGTSQTLTLVQPEGDAGAPNAYPLAVHVWDDHGFGVSLVHLRVWQAGTIVIDLADVPLHGGELWTVGKLHFPNQLQGGNFSPLEVCYQSGDACKAKQDPLDPLGGKSWQSQGKFCRTACYDNTAFDQSTGQKPGACTKP